MTGSMLTAANIVSLVRLALTVPIVILVVEGSGIWAVAICLFAAWTDWLDGYVARRTGTVSEWGMVFDPIADKVLVGGVMVALLLTERFPLWFVVAVLGRDLVILAGSIVATRLTQKVLPSLWSGKIAVSLIALTGVVAMVDQSFIVSSLMALSCAAMAVSLYDYARRLVSVAAQHKNSEL
jgi:cardiolipin synthase